MISDIKRLHNYMFWNILPFFNLLEYFLGSGLHDLLGAFCRAISSSLFGSTLAN